jgi:hypothetical protein
MYPSVAIPTQLVTIVIGVLFIIYGKITGRTACRILDICMQCNMPVSDQVSNIIPDVMTGLIADVPEW